KTRYKWSATIDRSALCPSSQGDRRPGRLSPPETANRRAAADGGGGGAAHGRRQLGGSGVVRDQQGARVSTQQQARDNTIASQVAALRERIAADGHQIEPDHAYVDKRYSGSIPVATALEQLRDAVAAGQIERVYVLAPDRLARRYAHQVLVMEEFRRAGVEIEFLNRPISGTAEDDLLLQIQGVVAEYERARILERSRRGRRHAARS